MRLLSRWSKIVIGEEDNTGLQIYFSEECISKIISFTSPKDACRSFLVQSVFRAAADSDAVWENVCDHPVLMVNSNMSFSLDKHSGKQCYSIGAKGVIIIWGNSPQYWKWTSIPESRFPQVAELKHAWWLEVKGRIETIVLKHKIWYEPKSGLIVGVEFRPKHSGQKVFIIKHVRSIYPT
ncbi:hypothetical protein L6164_013271 [Bauhinia variegata]|uniref:Uncharacterized protein n=1 Tax=Bauhinia variegata TaxID=167791 RepID=A0ACB9PBJ9_BAUVA|nr:hypothetical protein L6164_013271 [Bauhinia variegata]